MLSFCGRCHQLSPNPSSQRCSLHCRPPPRGLHAQPQPPAGQQRRALTSRIAAQGDGGAGPGVAKRLVCSLSALIDSSDYEAYACWQVASTRWPGSVPGPASLYVKYLRKVWEAAGTPVDGVLLTRVLAAEGVIGGRSAAGREGPVVGYTPRRVRPLNPIEIVAHWDILRDTCGLRHGLEEPGAWQRAIDEVSAALEHALQQGMPEGVPNCLCAHPAVRDALAAMDRRHCLVVLSPYPAATTQELLDRCGYGAIDLRIVCSSDVQSFADLQHVAQGDHRKSSSSELRETHVLMDSVRELELLSEKLLGPEGPGQLQKSLAQSWALDQAQESVADFTRASMRVDAFKMHLCGWGRSTAQMRAEAAAHGTMHALSSVELASLLGVSHVATVMDGIPWR